MERGIVTSWDDMEDFWHHILEQELRIRSNENITMLITEVPLNPKGNREKMIEVGLFMLMLYIPVITFSVMWVDCLSFCVGPVLSNE